MGIGEELRWEEIHLGGSWSGDRWLPTQDRAKQVAEKRPSVPRLAGFPSSFVVAACVKVRLTPQDFGSLASACLRVAASAEAGAFLSSLKKSPFQLIVRN